MPALPQSNGLVEIQGTKQKERGFCCMKLIKFLVRDSIKDWDHWHGAHLQAAAHNCPYQSECELYPQKPVSKKTIDFEIDLFAGMFD